MSDAYSTAVLALTPTAYLRFSETSGAPVADSSGNGHNATAAGTYTRNVRGSVPVGTDPAILLDGISGHADADTGSQWEPLHLGVVTWIRCGTIAGGNQRIVTKVSDDAGIDSYSLYVGTDGAAHFTVNLSGGRVTLTGPAVTDGLDHMLAATWDGTNVKLYVDGILYATGAGTGTYAGTNNAIPLRVGYFNGSFGQYFKGVVDEVAIFNFAPSQAQITALYAPSTRTPATYYVSPSGSDSNNGTSPSTPWQTVAKVNSANPNPGDVFAFLGGSTFSGNLLIANSGRPALPVKVTSYGTGKATINGGDTPAILVRDAAYVTVTGIAAAGSGIDSVGAGTSTDAAVKVYQTAATLALVPGVTIDDVDASGALWGVHATTATGVNIGTTGLRLTGIKAHSNRVSGIRVDAQGGGQPAGAHVGVYCGDCECHDNPGYAGDSTRETGSGMVWASVLHGLIERYCSHDNGFHGHNFVGGGGSAGFYAAFSTDLVFQSSEVYNQHSAADTGPDGLGVDWDTSCVNCTFQRNYIHDNTGAGVSIVGPGGADSGCVIRYNIIAGNDRGGVGQGQIITANAGTVQVYGNTVRATSANGVFGGSSYEDLRVYNNLFLFATAAAGRLAMAGAGPVNGHNILGNLYWREDGSTQIILDVTTYADLSAMQAAQIEMIGLQPVGVQADPMLSAPALAGAVMPALPVTALTNFDPAAGSPAVDGGINLRLLALDPGTTDFHGEPLTPRGGLPIGAVQYQTPGTPGDVYDALLAVFDAPNSIETGWTVRQALRSMSRVLLAKSTNSGNTFRDLNDSKDAVVGTTDSGNNRTAVTIDKT